MSTAIREYHLVERSIVKNRKTAAGRIAGRFAEFGRWCTFCCLNCYAEVGVDGMN